MFASIMNYFRNLFIAIGLLALLFAALGLFVAFLGYVESLPFTTVLIGIVLLTRPWAKAA
jgi:hypothetical protein